MEKEGTHTTAFRNSLARKVYPIFRFSSGAGYFSSGIQSLPFLKSPDEKTNTLERQLIGRTLSQG